MADCVKKPVDVEVYGLRYRILSPYETEYNQRLAGLLKERVDAVHQAAPKLLAQQALILVAFDLLDEVLQGREKANGTRRQLRCGVEHLIEAVDRRVREIETPES